MNFTVVSLLHLRTRVPGPGLMEECNRFPHKNTQHVGIKLAPGDVITTTAHQLAVDHVLHAVGPRFNFGGRLVLNILHVTIPYICQTST
jgi:O-acetyl-ADP-ribose deacetylase (regulator of RNase III)